MDNKQVLKVLCNLAEQTYGSTFRALINCIAEIEEIDPVIAAYENSLA